MALSGGAGTGSPANVTILVVLSFTHLVFVATYTTKRYLTFMLLQ